MVPPLSHIEKWWSTSILEKIGRVRRVIENSRTAASENALNLLKIAFCRVMIETANVSFGHQSMSFKQSSQQLSLGVPADAASVVASAWEEAANSVIKAAASPVVSEPEFIYCDARNLTRRLKTESVDCVITSPPYPNRMSYIRELRPYMYWLGYLDDAKQAGELDWKAIGGTWGVATSNVAKWNRPANVEVPFEGFARILQSIANANVQSGPILSKYVEKYFVDMVEHVQELFNIVRAGGSVHYVVGNSKFYDVMLPVEEIFASLFRSAGFVNVRIDKIRKRTSKKELFEYMVHANRLLN